MGHGGRRRSSPRRRGWSSRGLHDDDLSGFFVAAAPAIAGELRAALVALRADDV